MNDETCEFNRHEVINVFVAVRRRGSFLLVVGCRFHLIAVVVALISYAMFDAYDRTFCESNDHIPKHDGSHSGDSQIIKANKTNSDEIHSICPRSFHRRLKAIQSAQPSTSAPKHLNSSSSIQLIIIELNHVNDTYIYQIVTTKIF